MIKNRKFLVLFIFSLFVVTNLLQAQTIEGRWSEKRANEWYAKQPWLSGANFQPSTAINQIEMWASETFDAETIEKELTWAEELGFNLMRVYLSSAVWQEDPDGLKRRMDQYLTISDRHRIKTMFVFFDDCWNEYTTKGKQPEPKTGVHNSGWVQDPSCDLRVDTLTLYPMLERYVNDILSTFATDERILLWDLYNEPGNRDHNENSLPLLKNVFKWARDVKIVQPISVGIWYFDCNELNKFQLENSDIITYHNYKDEKNHQLWINFLKTIGRPLICTEYMARRDNSRFENIMPLLKKNNVGAINWGFVSGKTNTIFAWDEPLPDGKEPKLWFHDIYRKDKTPFDQDEIDIIKSITGKKTDITLIKNEDFATVVDNKKISLFTLKNRQGTTAQITNFGARVVALWVADRNNKFDDIVTGYKTAKEYLSPNGGYHGAIIGRYGNRIANGKFSLNEKKYSLAKNDGKNHLHGGSKGFHNAIWDARQSKNSHGEDILILNYLSKDGEEGYPGNLNVQIVYSLTNENELKIEYSATTDKETVVNLTHHSFFNLQGFSSGEAKPINDHKLKINADYYTPTNAALIPTGEITAVANTPMDFNQAIPIGERADQPYPALLNGKGYDHNWILIKKGDILTTACEVSDPTSGRAMRVLTTEPAIQFYGGNFFDGADVGKYGEKYNYRTAFALETQHYPDSPNIKEFPKTNLKPNEEYNHICIYKFFVK